MKTWSQILFFFCKHPKNKSSLGISKTYLILKYPSLRYPIFYWICQNKATYSGTSKWYIHVEHGLEYVRKLLKKFFCTFFWPNNRWVMHPKCNTFLKEVLHFGKMYYFFGNVLFLKMYYFWTYLGVPNFETISFLHYFTALLIIVTPFVWFSVYFIYFTLFF